jgi:hypothetical protein
MAYDEFDDPTVDEFDEDDFDDELAGLDEDHRGDLAGYDLDEQAAIEQLEKDLGDDV